MRYFSFSVFSSQKISAMIHRVICEGEYRRVLESRSTTNLSTLKRVQFRTADAGCSVAAVAAAVVLCWNFNAERFIWSCRSILLATLLYMVESSTAISASSRVETKKYGEEEDEQRRRRRRRRVRKRGKREKKRKRRRRKRIEDDEGVQLRHKNAAGIHREFSELAVSRQYSMYQKVPDRWWYKVQSSRGYTHHRISNAKYDRVEFLVRYSSLRAFSNLNSRLHYSSPAIFFVKLWHLRSMYRYIPSHKWDAESISNTF